ncbi:MAG: alpha/beta hydrolase [Intrasporangium sp.]|uniref:alpha/beta hydrolase family protein n=1 Tax=Intrasporangium sp. TaxID=1925024 RepID=UPI002647B66A|nr:alpha/beta hydrolase [Intrasporangium sp.]MDN5796746.1 alpha/beta hydrolase [Intrasporangium sp.]
MTDPTPDPRSCAVLGRQAPPPTRWAAYGDHPDQVYDVREPAHPLGATVLVVHGGFWRMVYDRAHVGSQAAALADAGFHVAVAEYRRGRMPPSSLPAALPDLRDLVAAVRADARLPKRLVLVGHSAGGQLVAWAANQPWAEDLAGVVVLAGCVDLAATFAMRLGDGAGSDWLGSTPEQAPEVWQVADPMTSLPPRVPVRLLHGRQDEIVPVSVTDRYVQRCRDLGADVRLEVLDGCGHYSLIDPRAPAFAQVVTVLHGLAVPTAH